MRVLIFHGYLLSGTGSNVYNASLARAMRRLGHEVHLLCQDREAQELDFVDAAGDWDEGTLRIREVPGTLQNAHGSSAAASAAVGTDGGSVTVYTPDTGGLLPVFVRDRYAGFEVRTYAELTDSELEKYIERNVQAVRDVVERSGEPDAALANHLVTAPLILERAGVRFAVKVHGSDLSYTVLPELDRFGPMARDGARAAAGILVGSDHIAERLREAVDEPEVNQKVALGPPGVDTDLFEAIARDDGPGRLRELAEDLEAADADAGADSSWERDPLEAAEAVRWLANTDGPRVVFVGKLIVSKGVDLLVAAWPLVHSRHPDARLILAGFGAYREGIESLIAALGEGDIKGARGIAHRGRALEGGPTKPLDYLSSFLADPPASYAEAAREAAGSITLAGRLEHHEVGLLVPACDALVFPSTHPEAFGMVAAEAAAAGVLPVSAAHSGALEVSKSLMTGLPDEAAGLVSFSLGDGAIEAIAARLNVWIELDPAKRRASRVSLRETAKRLWGWEGVANEVIAASRGDAPPAA
ncbi:MAG: glycosyltransferase [Actinomycetota bacterium]|nr:glycosyltransferase [Actinomycetota bacterium]